MTALGKLIHKTLFKMVNYCYCESLEWCLSFCRATFDRIAEININIDGGQDTVSCFFFLTYMPNKVYFMNIFKADVYIFKKNV